MANWEVKAYTFGHYAVPGRESWITVRTITNVISGKLTMTLNDTSKLTLTVQTSWHSDIQPVKTLLEVKHGDDRKFFGNVTKVTKDVVNGTMKVDAVGVLGSLQFIPNYRGYADSVDLNGIIECESKRYLGEYQSGDPEYVGSPWIDLYTPKGEGKIPSDFGKLSMSSYPSMHTTCNLDKVKRNAKNSYDFLKTITKENNYCLPTELQNPTWFKWVEYGEQAEFKPISGVNTQTISYKVNLMSGSLAISPYKSRVRKYYNMGSGFQGAFELTGTEYPIPYYYDSSTLPNKDDGSPYITAEVQKAVQHDLDERSTLIEATAFDAHLIDNTIPWLDMGKYVNVVYYDSSEQTAQAQITQIEYDLVDSSKDRVKLGRIVSSITDSLGASSSDVAKQLEEYLPLSGGTIQGDVKFQGNVVKHDSLKNIDVDLVNAYEPLVAYGTEIPSNENLNTPTYVNVGLYYRADNATVATFSNCPTTVGFSMLVRNVNKTDVNSSSKTWQYLTREIKDINGNQFIQTALCGSTVGTWVFGAWYKVVTTEVEDLTSSLTNIASYVANKSLRRNGSVYSLRLVVNGTVPTNDWTTACRIPDDYALTDEYASGSVAYANTANITKNMSVLVSNIVQLRLTQALSASTDYTIITATWIR